MPLQKPARILYLCNTASPLDATTSIPTPLSQRMDKTTTTSSSDLWFWVRRLFLAFVIGILYLHVQELLFPAFARFHGYIQENGLMHLFGWLITCIFIYQFYWICKNQELYPSVDVVVGIWLVVGLYIYDRFFYPSCHFWLIEEGSLLSWMDLLAFPFIFISLRQLYRVVFRRKRVWRTDLEEWGIHGIETDEAITQEAEDLLGFNSMVSMLFSSLCWLDKHWKNSSFTLGIIAPWGKGKTSFLNLLQAKLKERGDIIVYFNPRGSKSIAHIQEDFFEAFAKELSQYYMGFRLLLGRYTKQLGLLGQYEWTRPFESLLVLLLSEKSEQAINDALLSIGKRVYVIIDDLDRLTGEEIIEVLKLLDRNASFNDVIFVIAYDKEYINNVLRRHLDHGLDHSFIDKYVTWEVILPEIDSEVLRKNMRRYLSDILLVPSEEERERMLEGWGYVEKLITESLASVRHLKRYANLTLHRYREVYSKVDPADFFVLSLLQYKYLTIYNNLSKHMYIELSDDYSFYRLPVDDHALSEQLPLDALRLLQQLFCYLPTGRKDCDKLIRSITAFPSYFH